MEFDEDGDLVLQRKRGTREKQDIRHQKAHLITTNDLVHSDLFTSKSDSFNTYTTDSKVHLSVAQPPANFELHLTCLNGTSLNDVGLQVWAGAAVMVDYICSSINRFRGSSCIELGAGVGLVGLALAHVGSKNVIVTDTGDNVLANCHSNICNNPPKHQDALDGNSNSIRVKHLDWCNPPDWLLGSTNQTAKESQEGFKKLLEPPQQDAAISFSWSLEDIRLAANVDYILAADTVYDFDLTEAFMNTAALLCRHILENNNNKASNSTDVEYRDAAKSLALRTPKVLIALECRQCFTLRDLKVSAPAYDHWRSLFIEEGKSNKINVGELDYLDKKHFLGRKIDLKAVPQVLQGCGHRSDSLELWELTYLG